MNNKESSFSSQSQAHKLQLEELNETYEDFEHLPFVRNKNGIFNEPEKKSKRKKGILWIGQHKHILRSLSLSLSYRIKLLNNSLLSKT